MFFHDKVWIVGIGYRPDVDEACFAHHAEHKPAFAFYHLPVLITIARNEGVPAMGAQVVVHENEIA